MSLEDKIDTLIKAVQENTAAIKGGATAGAKAATGAKATAKSGVTFDQVKASCLAVRDHEKGGKGVISKIIKDVGKADALANIKEPQYAAVLKAAEEKLAELNEEDAGGGEESDEI